MAAKRPPLGPGAAGPAEGRENELATGCWEYQQTLLAKK